MVGRIDWDVFVDGQDWKLSDLKITPVSQSATQADIRATFTNFGDPRDILISLVLEDGHWRIDEVQDTLKPALDHVEDPVGCARRLPRRAA